VRKGTRRGTAVVVLSLLLVQPSLVEAKPSFWQRVKEPNTERAYLLYRSAERRRASIEPEYTSREINARLSEQAALMIELAGGEDLDDPQLMFLFGDCLVSADAAYNARGREVLLAAIQRYPTAPSVAKAWALIGIAAKRAGDTAGEVFANSRALETEWDSGHRAELFLRRGMAHMRMRNLTQAIFDLRAALGENTSREIQALAEWALAVALDRAYDLPSALPHARAAAAERFGPAGTLSALEFSWFDFSPKYDVLYYRALAQLAVARQTSSSQDLIGELQASQLLWLAFTKAAAADDPWLERAHQHLAHLREELAQLLGDPTVAAPN
jgi:hypothetical protein